VEQYYENLKSLGFETKECIDSAVNLFDRAKDCDALTQIDEDPDEVVSTPITLRDRTESTDDQKFLLQKAESTVKQRPTLDPSI